MNLKRNRRKAKHRHNRLARECRWGHYALGCRGHPGIIVETHVYPGDIWGSSIVIKSLIDGVEESCSLMNCVPERISHDEAMRQCDPLQRHIDNIRSTIEWYTGQSDMTNWELYRDRGDAAIAEMQAMNRQGDDLELLNGIVKSFDEWKLLMRDKQGMVE